MKVLDATFLIDYLDGREATREFYEENRGEQIRWVVPISALPSSPPIVTSRTRRRNG